MGLRFSGSPAQDRAIAKLSGLRKRSASANEHEAAAARSIATRLGHVVAAAELRAFVPARVNARLAEPDRFVVLCSDLPWWRAQLAILCASFAGFDDNGYAWDWNADLQDFEASIIGPPMAVLDATAAYAAASMVIVSMIPASLTRRRSARLLHAWLWGAVGAVEEELVKERQRRASEKAKTRRSDERDRTAMVHVPVVEGIEESAAQTAREEENPRPPPARASESSSEGRVEPHVVATGSPTLDKMFTDLCSDREAVAWFADGRRQHSLMSAHFLGRASAMPARWSGPSVRFTFNSPRRFL